MKTEETTNEKKVTNSFKKTLEKIIPHKEEEVFTAEKAWIETTYGQGSYQTVEKRIVAKQNHIKSMIRSKYTQAIPNGCINFTSYHCVVDIENDLMNHIDEVFKPFKDNGFKVINLSERIEEIEDEYVFLISWKNAFKKQAVGD